MGARLGVVSFLNTRPLVEAFRTGALSHDFELIYDVPSVCADKLHRGQTDVALIPAAEIGRGAYVLVPEVGLASNGPVRSVLLLLGKEPEEVRTLALDVSSRTSVVLSQIVLARQFGCRPDVFVHPPDVDAMLARADAALLIGDPALELDVKRYRVLDLGEAWTQMTGLPFVYACWTGRPGAMGAGEVARLIEAKTLGLAEIPSIAAMYAAGHKMPPAFYADYLRRNMCYDLGEAEQEGMRLFYAYGAELGLIAHVPELRFYTRE